MRQQKAYKGHIGIDRNNWTYRWRQSVDGTGKKKMHFRVLSPVLPEHWRNKDRRTGKPRIPAEIIDMAKGITAAAESSPASVFITLGEFVAQYLADKKDSLRHSSYVGMQSFWRVHLERRIGHKRLREIKRSDCFQLWKAIARDNPTMTRTSLANIRGFLQGVFRSALNLGLYDGENPANAELEKLGVDTPPKHEFYTVEEVALILSLMGEDQDRAIVALAFGSGMRRGELQGLRWTDYERTDEGATIHVRQSIPSNSRGRISAPKTQSSADDIYIGHEVCAYVEAYRESCGNPTEGLMFHAGDFGTFARRKLRPLLNYCVQCHEETGAPIGAWGHADRETRARMKEQVILTVPDHDYQPRSEVLPEWKGFHAFRRGNATFLYQTLKQQNAAGGHDAIKAASLSLRHAGTDVTERHYIQGITKQEKRAMQAGKLVEIGETRSRSAAAIGDGIKTAVQ